MIGRDTMAGRNVPALPWAARWRFLWRRLCAR
jgi:hypothetical protein